MKKLLSLSIILLLVLSLAGCSVRDVFSGTKTIKDKHELFQLTVPSSLKTETNDYVKEYSLGVYDETEEVYLYGDYYDIPEDVDLLAEITNERDTTENVTNVSEVKELTIQDYKTYTYSYDYTDTDLNKDFHNNVVYIQTSNYIYILDLEVVSANANKYQDELIKIAESFVEI